MSKQHSKQSAQSRSSRRAFLSAAASTAFSFTIVPRHVLGGQGQTPPSERLNVAGIGCGGMGGGDIATVSKLGANMVALCDVDEERAGRTLAAHPKARRDNNLCILLAK